MQKKILLPLAVLAVFGMVACQNNDQSASSSGTSEASSSESSSSEAELPLAGAGAASLVNYQGKTYAEKSKILAALESYTMTKHLSGIPLYDSGSLEEFSQRVTLPTTKYITNYGFGTANATIDPDGIMFDGVISESNEDWTSYFHEATTADSGTVNYWDSTGSDVADEYSTIQASLFDVIMKDDKSGYNWRGALSEDSRPVELDAEGGSAVSYTEGALSKFWRVHVKTGSSYKYHTLSSTYAAFNNTEIKLADYLTPVKAMLGVYGKAALKRGTDISGTSAGFAGASDFLGAENYDLTADDWTTSGVGFQANATEDSIDIEFASAKTQFGAMYAIADSLFAPVPQEFIKALGVTALGTGKTDAEYYAAGIDAYGVIGSDSTDATKNSDNVLSTGAYDQESWEKDKVRSYKKNPNYVNASEINFDGIVETAYLGEDADETMYNDLKLNKLDVVAIPTAYVSIRKSDATCYKVPGTVITKMNTNSCTDSEWEYYFGTDGTIYPHDADKYWDVKAVMSNDDFLDGVYFSMDRTELADLQGRSVGLGYLSEAYMVDPESGVGYRDSEDGEGVLADYAIGTNSDGHDDATAQTYFKKAMDALIADGSYEKGTSSEPTEITLTYYFRYATTITSIGSYLKKYIEDNFNAACKTSLGITLTVDEEVAGSSYTDCYDKMDQGVYDFADGAIQGSALDPLNFMNTCCTNSLAQGFCLNWGERTDLVSAADPVTYGGYRWSYDALWTVANGTGIIKDGVTTSVMGVDYDLSGTDTNKENVIFAIDYTDVVDDAGASLWTFDLDGFYIYYADSLSFSTYVGLDMTSYVSTNVDTDNKVIEVTISVANFNAGAQYAANKKSFTVAACEMECDIGYTADVSGIGETRSVSANYIDTTLEDLGLESVAPVSSSRCSAFARSDLPLTISFAD
jgi:hypothetical protein